MSIAAQSPFTPSAKSIFTLSSPERDQDPSGMLGDDFEVEIAQEDAVHFCLLAEFDIDAGATLAYQYPYPTGTDEQ